MNYKHLIAASALAVSATSAAQEVDTSDWKKFELDNGIGLIDHVYLVVHDDITGGCWSNINAVKNRVRAKLSQANISVYDEHLAFYDGYYALLEITGTGYRSGGMCVGMIDYAVYADAQGEILNFATNREWSYPVQAVLFERLSVANNPNNLNQQFLSTVDSATDEIIGDIYEGRRIDGVGYALSIILKDRATTQEELQDFLERNEE